MMKKILETTQFIRNSYRAVIWYLLPI